MAGAVLLATLVFPLVLAREHGSPFILIVIALCVAQFFLGMMYGPQAALFAEMFSARVRYSGASIGYQGASVFAGGLAPIIMVWLLDTTGTSLSVSFYLLAMCCHHLLLGLPDHRDLRGRDDRGTRYGRRRGGRTTR